MRTNKTLREQWEARNGKMISEGLDKQERIRRFKESHKSKDGLTAQEKKI
jgi:hypothetical protein